MRVTTLSDLIIAARYGRVNFTVPLAHYLSGVGDICLLASFPRSGNTWVRTVVSNLLEPATEGDPQVFNRLIPDVKLTSVWTLKRRHFQMAKSHSVYRKRFQKAIYIVRDGRDVLVSFYHYTITRRGIKKRFSDWFDEYTRGLYGPLWHEHVESWLGEGREVMGANMEILVYEDIKQDSIHYFEKVCEFLQMERTRQEIVSAINDASIERAKSWESHYAKGSVLDRDQSFYRGGKTGEWKEHFSPLEYERFMKMSRIAMKMVGYE